MSTMQSVGKYQLVKELGKGASAKVYLAEDPFAKRKVAIKVAFPEALKSSEPVVVIMGAIVGFAAIGGGFEFAGEGGGPFLPGEIALLGELHG